jgi:dephospho-CoA kinase
MRWLAELGARTIDADALVHRLYETDRALQEQLQARFGAQVVVGGRVDRAALGKAVFGGTGTEAALADLEALTHPAVLYARDEEIAQARAEGVAVLVIEAIKLIESGGSARCDELWIVTAAEAVQLARLAARGVPEAKARRRLAAQGTVASWTAAFQSESLRLGQPRPIVIFDNSGDEAQGREQVARLWNGVTQSPTLDSDNSSRRSLSA